MSWMINVDDPARLEIVKRAKALGITGSPDKAAHPLGKITLKGGKTVNAHVIHAIDAVITDGDEVVMIDRKNDPGRGLPALPGGFIDPNEDGGVENAIAASAREAMEEAGIDLTQHKGTLIGTRNMDRPHDVRVATFNVDEPGISAEEKRKRQGNKDEMKKKYGVEEGDIFMVSTQAVRFDVPDLKNTTLTAGDDALPGSARRVKIDTLTREGTGMPDHFDMIHEAIKQRQSAKKHSIVYGNGVPMSMIDKISATTAATEIPTSQGTYIEEGMPFVEFWPKVAGFTAEEILREKESLKDGVVTIVQSVGRPYAENFAYAKLAARNAKRFGAKTVHMVLPFYDLREDKEYEDRGTSFANPMYARELKEAGVDYVTFMAPHSTAGVEQFAEVFGKNVSVVSMDEIMVPLLREQLGTDTTNIANGAPDGWDKPDDQAVNCARAIARELHGNDYEPYLFGIEKKRSAPGQSAVVAFHGNVKGKKVIIADDMIDGGGTVMHAAEQAYNHGATEIVVCAPHGIFSRGLATLLAARNKDGGLLIDKIITTNTLNAEQAIAKARMQFPNIKDRVTVADISPFVVREMDRVAGMVHAVERNARAVERSARTSRTR